MFAELFPHLDNMSPYEITEWLTAHNIVYGGLAEDEAFAQVNARLKDLDFAAERLWLDPRLEQLLQDIDSLSDVKYHGEFEILAKPIIIGGYNPSSFAVEVVASERMIAGVECKPGKEKSGDRVWINPKSGSFVVADGITPVQISAEMSKLLPYSTDALAAECLVRAVSDADGYFQVMPSLNEFFTYLQTQSVYHWGQLAPHVSLAAFSEAHMPAATMVGRFVKGNKMMLFNLGDGMLVSVNREGNLQLQPNPDLYEHMKRFQSVDRLYGVLKQVIPNASEIHRWFLSHTYTAKRGILPVFTITDNSNLFFHNIGELEECVSIDPLDHHVSQLMIGCSDGFAESFEEAVVFVLLSTYRRYLRDGSALPLQVSRYVCEFNPGTFERKSLNEDDKSYACAFNHPADQLSLQKIIYQLQEIVCKKWEDRYAVDTLKKVEINIAQSYLDAAKQALVNIGHSEDTAREAAMLMLVRELYDKSVKLIEG